LPLQIGRDVRPQAVAAPLLGIFEVRFVLGINGAEEKTKRQAGENV